jgi:hypothetical protein
MFRAVDEDIMFLRNVGNKHMSYSEAVDGIRQENYELMNVSFLILNRACRSPTSISFRDP